MQHDLNRVTVSRITLAVTQIDQMVGFYTSVFKCEFSKMKAYGTTLYSTSLAGVELLLCPNEIAQVDARQNRHQFDFIVPDLEGVIHDAKNSGGKMKGEVISINKQKAVTIIDPDGNTIVFIQRT